MNWIEEIEKIYGNIFKTKLIENNILDNKIYLFKKQSKDIGEYIGDYFAKNTILKEEFFIKIHKMLFEKNENIYMIQYDGKVIISQPGDFRKCEYINNSDYIDASKIKNIKIDLDKLLEKYNKIIIKKRTDILELYFKLIEIHPFEDANGRLAGIIRDIECLRYGFPKLNMLNIRCNSKNDSYKINYLYCNNKIDINEMINKIDFYNKT